MEELNHKRDFVPGGSYKTMDNSLPYEYKTEIEPEKKIHRKII
jgi:hypothetical protein